MYFCYKFKSAKDYDSVAIDSQFIFVGQLKEKIFEKKKYGRGIDYDLIVTYAQTNEEYVDEGMLIPKNTSVLIRRVPGPPRMPIKTDAPVSEQEEPNVETKPAAEEFDWGDFGNDIYAIPETVPVHSSIFGEDTRASKEEESKMKALIETCSSSSGLDCCDGYGGGGRGFGRGGFGRGGLFEKKTPPQGYTCHRCKVPGHFIQHCPTNGDPNFDKPPPPPTGIPKMATRDGSFAVTTRPVPPELHCPLCKQVMKDAVLSSKCCFASFCDACIRDYIFSKARCVCGATNVVADDLFPNKILRDTINRFLDQSRNPQANKVPSSPTQSVAILS